MPATRESNVSCHDESIVSDKDIPSSVAGDEEAMVALLLRTGCQFSCLRLCLEIEAFT